MGFGRNAGTKTPTGMFGSSRPGTPDLGNLEEGFAADTEDLEYFNRRNGSPGDEKKGSGRKSWLHFGHSDEKRRESTDMSGGERIPMSPTTRVPGDSSAEAGPSRNTSQDFDNVVRSGNGKMRGRGRKDGHYSGSTTPNGLGNGQAHTYPPTAADVRNSLDAQSVLGGQQQTGQDDGQVFTQAAKALKAAVLHDARNIKGKDTTEADISFTITSPHEAKVRVSLAQHKSILDHLYPFVHIANTNLYFALLETSSQFILRFPSRQETNPSHPIRFLSSLSQTRRRERSFQDLRQG